LAEGVVQLKNMATGDQTTAPLADLVDAVRTALAEP
jgi:histidyl-tRNA synthetase